ncbi:Cell division control protein 1 [Colletotrichum gloeosporioides]|uniref:Cell division control protein 1 n=1 Tax=Colletotrichum gloeosporioides TaxID=474922 RepID=A0A8H4CP28_COLGL|nr:Cell division control protein 1 [Colletotrichum gloeosporioides]KAF3807503.1 Cell division control protein 1 [Colletotrichum gloeosporioides]
MAPPYSNGYAYKGKGPSALLFQHSGGSFRDRARPVLNAAARLSQRLWHFWQTRGRRMTINMLYQAGWQLRQNLTARRLLSFPHLLVCLWMLILLWGERWVFSSRVADCRWSNWESWPAGANPHHLIFVADPQITDPHSYPGRPWPLSELTVLITDNYLRRGFTQLQSQLIPDSLFFLGDLFDGGREWKTGKGDWADPEWAAARRPKSERPHAKEWNEHYGDKYWLSEYERFGDIFFSDWASLGGTKAGNWQRGRKLVASLPGNHDLGYGDQVKVSVRERFASFFGDVNRVDVIGNHSIVSVDTLSLSASSSVQAERGDLRPIHTPADVFLKDVKFTKRKAVEKELRFWRGDVEGLGYNHLVEDLETADVENVPTIAPGEDGPDFPTILLTHVPLYRDPGTPCGPYREHWPPAKPPRGQKGPVIPDHRNAISVSGGYQYQNVLDEDASVNLVKSVGNVVHVFSGDDHDYCEVVHSPKKESVREITVKSMSMAMGVPTPGFLMVSLYNPVDANGKPLPGAPEKTLQTHLCLLPNQLATYAKYVGFIFVSIVAISIRSFLVPVLNLTPFALEAEQSNGAILPTFKEKVEDEGTYNMRSTSASSGTRYQTNSSSRTRSGSLMNGSAPLPPPKTKQKKQGWGHRTPRIEIFQDDFYGAGKPRLTWKAASQRSRTTVGRVVREIGFSTWRVTWMVVLFWSYLAYKG